MRILILTGLLLLCSVAVGPCRAQAVRTWVSGVGDDANPCSRTAPCKTFAGAISKTAAGGEINCLDPGGFGVLTITKALTIYCDNVGGSSVLAAGTNGITVNLPAGASKVVLSGLDLEGAREATTPGINGVNIIGQGQVTIRNSSIRDFGTAGVNLQGAAGTPAPRVVVDNCYISNNGTGINVAGANGTANNAEVIGSLIDSNSTSIAVGQGGALVLGSSVLTGATTAIATTGDGKVISYSNNIIRNPGNPTQTLPLQ